MIELHGQGNIEQAAETLDFKIHAAEPRTESQTDARFGTLNLIDETASQNI